MKKLILCCSALLIMTSAAWAEAVKTEGDVAQNDKLDCKIFVDNYLSELREAPDVNTGKSLSPDQVQEMRGAKDDCEVKEMILAGYDGGAQPKS